MGIEPAQDTSTVPFQTVLKTLGLSSAAVRHSPLRFVAGIDVWGRSALRSDLEKAWKAREADAQDLANGIKRPAFANWRAAMDSNHIATPCPVFP